MAPSQPEIHRSGRTPLDPDHIETETQVGHPAPTGGPGQGPVPTDNQPGHHPDHEQDKPDLDDFAARFGTAAHGVDHDAPIAGDRPTADTDGSASSGEDEVDDGRTSLPGTVWHLAGTAIGAGETVARMVGGPVVSRLRSALSTRGEEERCSSATEADRIARLESRLADLERRVERQQGS